LSGNIPTVVSDMAKSIIERNGMDYVGYNFSDNSITFTVYADNKDKCVYVASLIRRETSGPVRSLFKELWSMPSLWTNRALITKNAFSNKTQDDVNRFLSTIKSR